MSTIDLIDPRQEPKVTRRTFIRAVLAIMILVLCVTFASAFFLLQHHRGERIRAHQEELQLLAPEFARLLEDNDLPHIERILRYIVQAHTGIREARLESEGKVIAGAGPNHATPRSQSATKPRAEKGPDTLHGQEKELPVGGKRRIREEDESSRYEVWFQANQRDFALHVEFSRSAMDNGFTHILGTLIAFANASLLFGLLISATFAHWTSREVNLLTQDYRSQEKTLREQNAHTTGILEGVQTGILLVDPLTHTVVDANPIALSLIDEPMDAVVGKKCCTFICSSSDPCVCPNASEGPLESRSVDCMIPDPGGHLLSGARGNIPVVRTVSRVVLNGEERLLVNFTDVSELRALLKQNELDIDLAKNILNLINKPPARYVELSRQRTLFVQPFHSPCRREGGDHFLLRTLGHNGSGRTLLSLKDQSGHEVDCVLRSLATDLIHNAILKREEPEKLEDTVTRLNRDLCRSKLLREEHFITSIDVEIHHDSLRMRCVSAGHPPLIIVRGQEVFSLPSDNNRWANLPIGTLSSARYQAEEYQLQEGDMLFMYTDGLTEMPLANGGTRISHAELIEIIRDILVAQHGARASEIQTSLLRNIARLSQVEVVPSGKNTSQDDVSLIGIEIERPEHIHMKDVRISTNDQLSDFILKLANSITDQWGGKIHNAHSRLLTTLEEGLLNAWRHGSRQSPDRFIRVRWWEGNDLNIEISDEGEGFDPSSVQDPAAPENRLRETGRGIFMIRRSASHVRWSDGGRRLTASFEKALTPTNTRKHRAAAQIDLWNVAVP